MNLIMGVDPGKTGAVAFLDEAGNLVHVEDMAQLTGAALGTWLVDLLDDLAPDRVVEAWVEDVHSMPKQGVRSVWTFAEGHGVILGALGAARIRTELVTPARWKKAAGLNKDKTASRLRASTRWPDQARMFARVKDDGRAEAALIALYGSGAS